MRVLVTGGAGYIGGFTTRALLEAGHEVTVVDNLVAGNARAAGGASLVVADLADQAALEELLAARRVEAVMHFAALKSVAQSWVEPEHYRDVNVTGTRHLLAAMQAAGTELLVYSSTCAVYGTPETSPVDESYPTAPMNPYGETKLEAEAAIREVAHGGGPRYCSLRYFNAAGADAAGRFGEDPAHSVALVPSVIKAVLGDMPFLPVYGTDYPTPDGTAVRDYIHVEDLAQGHLRALHYLAGGGESQVLNLGTGRGTSVREVIAAVETATGKVVPVREEDRRRGDPAAIWADASRAHAKLGWQAEYGIEDIVASAWRWQSARRTNAS
jgi:UDP-arabinose 4-epimerase